MEITATPRRRAWWAACVRIVAVVALVLAVGLLVPAALGLQRHVVTDPGGAYPRGSLVFDDQVAVEELAAGDVVIDDLAGAGGTPGLVARAILDLDGEGYSSRSEGTVTTHLWHGQRQRRVAFGVPVLGYPALVPGGVTVLLGSLVALVAAARLWRVTGWPGPRRRRGAAGAELVAELPTPGSSTVVAG